MVERSRTLGTLVSTKTKCIKLIFIGKITLVPVAFLMALSIVYVLLNVVQSSFQMYNIQGLCNEHYVPLESMLLPAKPESIYVESHKIFM